MAEPRRRSTIATRLLVVYAVTFVLVLILLGFLTERSARGALLDEVESGLTQQALTVADFVPAVSGEIQAWVDLVSDDIEARVTVVSPTGEVEGDSIGDRTTMENHIGRLEIDAALEGRVGTDRRLSASTGARELYVAVLGQSGHVVRLSLPESSVGERVSALRSELLWLVALAGALGVVVVAAVGRLLARPLVGLAEAASAVAAGDLAVDVPRSAVDELDRLGLAIASMATELGARLAEVEAERRTLGVVLDALPQGTLLVGADDGILYANRSLADILGPVPTTLGKVTPFRIQELVRQARSEGGPLDVDMEHGRPGRVLQVLVSPLDGARVLVVVGDVTERRRINEVRRDFVTNASHELKTPVASILASAETLQIAVERAPDRVPQFAAQIVSSARSLARLVSDLLDLSRLESRVMEREDVDLSQLVWTEVDAVLPLAAERGIRLISEISPLTVRGSAPDLALAVRNLLSNAVRYTEDGGEVRVSLHEDSERKVLTIADTGVGIPQRDLDRIFERFYRVDVARSRSTGGTGLGLSMVRHVVEAHGGRVGVESELGAGSSFTIELPSD